MKQIPGKIIAIVGSLAASAAIAAFAYQNNSAEHARAGIEQLHQLDVEATLSDKADELAKLWDSEAVRIQPGRARRKSANQRFTRTISGGNPRRIDQRRFATSRRLRTSKSPEIGRSNGAISHTRTRVIRSRCEAKCSE